MTGLSNPVDYHVYRHEPLPVPELYAYIMAGQGVLKWAERPAFGAAIPVANGSRIAGLPDYPLAGVRLRLPRIPARLLERVHRDAMAGVGEIVRPVETMYHFHFIDGVWRVARPRQDGSGSRVSYRGGDEEAVALDLHSHHQMAAYFSETDDEDEQGFRFYAVIGCIYSRPRIRLRIGVYGDWLELDPLLLFEGLGPFERDDE